MNYRFYKMYTSQIDEMDCGVACLSMILKYYGSYYSLATLRDLAKTNKSGTTALGLVTAANKLNLKSVAIKTDISIFDSNQVHYPFIAHVIINDNLTHYYVVLKSTKKYIFIADPNPDKKILKLTKEKFSKLWTGVALFFSPQPAYTPFKEENKGLFSLVPNIFKQKKLILNIFLAALLITLINIVGSYFFQYVIDNLIPSFLPNMIIILTICLAIAYIFQGIYSFSRDFLLSILGQRLSIDINLGFIQHIFKLPLSFFSTRKTGEITSRFSDAGKIINALGNIIVSTFLDLGIICFVGIFLFIQSKKLFAITLLAIPVYCLLILAFNKSFSKLDQDQMEKNAHVSSSIIESIRGIENIKASNSEAFQYSKIDNQYVSFLKKNLKYTKLDKIQQSIKLVIFNVLNITIICIGGISVINSKIQLGQLITYVSLLSYFTKSIQNIVNLQPSLQSAKVAFNRLNEINRIKIEGTDSGNKIPIDDFKHYKLNNVSFKYGLGNDTLKNISLIINKGEKISIVGESGSGKSTLAKLLVAFFSPSKGKININDIPIDNVDTYSLRNVVRYVPQNPFIFSGTVLENITFGAKDNISMEDVISACDLAEIKEDIENMPFQYNSKLDEEGSVLSGGQKQRIAIARALLSPAKVIIFDEFTSALDPITENKIIKKITKLSEKTFIFIVHRLSVTKYTSKVIVMKEGKIVELGDREKLLNNKGEFYKMLKGATYNE